MSSPWIFCKHCQPYKRRRPPACRRSPSVCCKGEGEIGDTLWWLATMLVYGIFTSILCLRHELFVNLLCPWTAKGPGRCRGPLPVCVVKGEGEMGDTLWWLAMVLVYGTFTSISCPRHELFVNSVRLGTTKCPGRYRGTLSVCCKKRGRIGVTWCWLATVSVYGTFTSILCLCRKLFVNLICLWTAKDPGRSRGPSLCVL